MTTLEKANVQEDFSKAFPTLAAALQEELLNSATLMYMQKDDEPIQMGQYFRSAILIVDGVIKLYRQDDEGNSYFLYQLAAGDACALSMIMSGEQLKSQIRAVTEQDATIIAVPVEKMDLLARQHDSWYQFALATYRKRFDELLQTLDDVAFKSMDERLLSYLRRQVQHTGAPLITLTHQQIANDLNSSREVVSRLLKKLEQRGLVRLNRTSIEWMGGDDIQARSSRFQ